MADADELDILYAAIMLTRLAPRCYNCNSAQTCAWRKVSFFFFVFVFVFETKKNKKRDG
jgi:hypothetical protein